MEARCGLRNLGRVRLFFLEVRCLFFFAGVRDRWRVIKFDLRVLFLWIDK